MGQSGRLATAMVATKMITRQCSFSITGMHKTHTEAPTSECPRDVIAKKNPKRQAQSLRPAKV
jgi:hypothetical protein